MIYQQEKVLYNACNQNMVSEESIIQ